ncbi:4'-phosphopantetheinyl transferase superfamily protein [Leifsonia sp. ZF2019]|uniref:4'-phosphopantetheinyl transferase family protein n=1 Tax=Leifsonia sp. ZF2019 TaxID=2781978 RepID=UPI001CBB54E9|nr:4'-phosphopantetheinyl transferase superfamily protein [Leifsonia sp. ZF2019]UAJ78385.1 4'-phosphopantetheinyl transferase superfamily protein [Leifsonia sp. ZF2019]
MRNAPRSDAVIPSGSALVLVASTARVLEALPDEPLAADAAARRDRLRRAADRDDFTAARLLAAAAHRALTGDSIAAEELVQRCDSCGGAHGRPQPTTAGLHLSWSHANGTVAAGAARGRLGVDVEGGTPASDGMPDAALSPAERRILAVSADPGAAFLLSWTAKEALAKAGAARLDGFAGLIVLADDRRLAAGYGPFALASRRGEGFCASAATPGPVLWRTLDADGGLVPFTHRAVGGAA